MIDDHMGISHTYSFFDHDICLTAFAMPEGPIALIGHSYLPRCSSLFRCSYALKFYHFSTFYFHASRPQLSLGATGISRAVTRFAYQFLELPKVSRSDAGMPLRYHGQLTQASLRATRFGLFFIALHYARRSFSIAFASFQLHIRFTWLSARGEAHFRYLLPLAFPLYFIIISLQSDYQCEVASRSIITSLRHSLRHASHFSFTPHLQHGISLF